MSPTYEEFDALVGRLKRAAIDALMADDHFYVDGDVYRGTKLPGEWIVDRPGVDGSGGGDGTYDDTGPGATGAKGVIERRADFDRVRSEIDALVEPWSYLPVTASLDELEDRYVALNTRLAGTAQFSESYQVSGVGIIATNLEQARANAGSFTGQSAEHFKSDFLWRIGAVGGGIWAMSVLGTAMVHLTRVLWETAQQDVANVLDQARIAMEQSVVGDENAKASLKIASVLVDVAQGFIPGIGGAVLGAVGIVIDLATEASPRAVEVPLGGTTYGAVRDNLAAALKQINEKVTLQEQIVESTLLKNLDAVQALGKTIRHPDGGNLPATSNPFDLQVPPISSTKGITITSYGLLAGIWQECLPKVAHELEECAIDLRFIMVFRMLMRSDGIGHLPAGFDELGRKIDEMAQDLAWDVRQGAKDLELLVKAMQSHDEASAEKLRDFAKKMSQPGPYDPWD